MRKSKVRRPTAILCADLHLRETTPTCRTDDYWAAQYTKIEFLDHLSRKPNEDLIPILCAGDVFDLWNPEDLELGVGLLTWAIRAVPNMLAIPGQHDLPNHSLKLYKKSNLAALETAKKCKVFVDSVDRLEMESFTVFGFPYGDKIGSRIGKSNRIVALIHTLVNCPGDDASKTGAASAEAIFKQMPGFDLIVSGDNHKSFTVRSKDGKQLLCNPGSMMRTKADQIDHKPCIYLWYAEDNTVTPVYFPIEQGVVSREHIEKKEAKENRHAAFVSSLREGVEVGGSFEGNMKKYIQKNKVEKDVEEIVYQCMERKNK